MNPSTELPVINPQVRARVIAVADQMYEQNGHTADPPVDTVRRLAKAGMNETSIVMREWRRNKSKIPTTAVVDLPDRLRKMHETTLAAIWAEAQGIASDALKLAQTSWEIERGDAEKLRMEIAAAFEAQGQELEAAQSRIVELEGLTEKSTAQTQFAAQQLEEAHIAKSEAERRAVLSDQRTQDLEQQIFILRSELNRAHQRSETAEQELKEANAKIESAATTINELREKTAHLRGELEASRQQYGNLMRLFENIENPKQGKRSRNPV